MFLYIAFQIDPETVKRLDSNLYRGNEINEVYKEIMRTMPTDHLDLENVRTCSRHVTHTMTSYRIVIDLVSGQACVSSG